MVMLHVYVQVYVPSIYIVMYMYLCYSCLVTIKGHSKRVCVCVHIPLRHHVNVLERRYVCQRLPQVMSERCSHVLLKHPMVVLR